MASDIPVINYGTDSRDSFTNAWWTVEKEVHGHIFAKVQAIRDNQSNRRVDWLRFARLYTNTDFDQFISGIVAGAFGRRLSFNVCRSCVDTATAKIAKAKHRPLFLTENGNFSQQNRAKKLTQYSDGMFADLKIYNCGKQVFKDASIFGTGAIKFFNSNGGPKAERVFIDEIVVDEVDGRNMMPREMHQTKMIHREVLVDTFPKFKKEIAAATLNWDQNKKIRKTTSDMIGVVESWHLPSGLKAKDGRHVIALENITLLDEVYEKDYFPFVFLRWNNPLLGFYGEGLVAQLVGIQLEINTVLLRIKEAQELVAVPRIWVEEGSGVATSQLTNEIGAIGKYRGQAPIFQTPIGMNREVYDYLEYLYRKAFEDTGISQLSASSKKPAGLDSRVALREFQDIETERFSIIAEAYQQMYLDAASILIDLQRDLADAGEDPKVKVKGRDFIETIKWKDVDLENDKFIMQAYPTNLLPRTPEGQLEFTQELVQSGFIETEEALSLLNFPDLKGFFNLKTAAIDDIKFILENIIEHKEYTAPEAYMDLQLAVKMSQAAYLRSKTDGTPEDVKELLRRFIDECTDMLSAATAPEPVPGAQGPIAAPVPQPMSDLIPFNRVQ